MSTITGVSSVTPAAIISTTRTAATAAASSTANPYDSGSIVTWSLPGKTAQKLVNGTQSYSTKAGEVFIDFAQSNILATTTTSLSLQEGTPKQND